MITLLEDLRLALSQICRATGLSGTGLTVVPLVVLGIAMNVAALSIAESLRSDRHSRHEHAGLRSAALTELKVVRTVLGSTVKKIGDSQRRWCPARHRVTDQQKKSTHIEVGFVWSAPGSDSCDIEMVGSHRWKTVALVQC
jgi:hypothetical protein